MTERRDEPDITVVAQSTFGDLNRPTSNESLPPPDVRKAARERIQQRRDEPKTVRQHAEAIIANHPPSDGCGADWPCPDRQALDEIHNHLTGGAE